MSSLRPAHSPDSTSNAAPSGYWIALVDRLLPKRAPAESELECERLGSADDEFLLALWPAYGREFS